MKLKNRFKEEDKLRVWGDHPYCAVCYSNQNCSIHHIDSTSSSSIYNSIMLCHIHHKEADGHNTNSPLSTEYREKLRAIAYTKVTKSGHKNTKEDENYNALHKTNLS